MIYDSLDQLSRYTGLSRSLDAAVKANNLCRPVCSACRKA